MQYFVSAENSSYFYWQLELLIESFLMLGMEDSLVIGLAENDSQKVATFSKNLIRHPRKFIHDNVGAREGYLPLNRIVALRYALATGQLRFPFALIHADMVIRRPILIQEDEPCGAILNNFDISSEEEKEEISAEIQPNLKALAAGREVAVSDLPVIPFISYPMVFTEKAEYVSDVLFSRVQISETEIFGRRGGDFPCERAAWKLSLAESFQHFVTKGAFMSAPVLYDGDDLNFIHYSEGIPPIFHKRYYHYKDAFYLSGTDPHQMLLEGGATVNAEYLKGVVKSYGKRKYS